MSDPRLSVIPAGAVTDARLEGRDLQVLCLLGRHIDDAGWCRRSQVKMAREIRCARSTVQASLDRLIEAGWVSRRIETRPSGGDTAHSYRVILDAVKPLAECMAEAETLADTPAGGADLSAGVPTQERQGVPIHASAPMLTTPLNESERDARARDPEAEPGPPHIPNADLLDRLKRDYPHASQADQDEAEAAWRTLKPAERREAVDRLPDWLADRGPRQQAVLGLVKYLRQKPWQVVVAKQAAEHPDVAPKAGAFDRPWWWLFWDFVARYGAQLGRRDSAALRHLKTRISLAQSYAIGWPLGVTEGFDAPADIADLEARAANLATVGKGSGTIGLLHEHVFRIAGISMPLPDRAEFIFAPPDLIDQLARADEGQEQQHGEHAA